MKRSIPVLLAVALLCRPLSLDAQNIPKDFVHDVRNGVVDIFGVWVSPFRGSAKEYEFGAASLGLVGLAALQDDNVAAWVRKHPNAGVMRMLLPVREGQGDIFVKSAGGSGHLPGAFGLYTVGLLVRSRGIRDAGMGCLAAGEAHSALRQLVYMSVSRERPLFRDSVNGVVTERPGHPYDIHFPGKATGFDNSFFGGHAASMFSCATFVNTRFHLRYAEPLIWAFAGALALGRIADQKHYTSDILVGSLIGYGAGRVVAHRSLARAEKREQGKVHVAPDSSGVERRSWTDGLYLSRSNAAMVLGWRTQF